MNLPSYYVFLIYHLKLPKYLKEILLELSNYQGCWLLLKPIIIELHQILKLLVNPKWTYLPQSALSLCMMTQWRDTLIESRHNCTFIKASIEKIARRTTGVKRCKSITKFWKYLISIFICISFVISQYISVSLNISQYLSTSHNIY